MVWMLKVEVPGLMELTSLILGVIYFTCFSSEVQAFRTFLVLQGHLLDELYLTSR